MIVWGLAAALGESGPERDELVRPMWPAAPVRTAFDIQMLVPVLDLRCRDVTEILEAMQRLRQWMGARRKEGRPVRATRNPVHAALRIAQPGCGDRPGHRRRRGDPL